MKKLFCLFWLGLSLVWLLPVFGAQGELRIISYGRDLTPAERTEIIKDFPLPAGVSLEEIKSITVTNEEEWNLLRGLVPDEQIGVKAVSSAYIEKLAAGVGIKVDTKNITLITPHIYANALSTAGVTDARIFATAPQPVSGTAALVGIFKSFESLTGKPISSSVQRTAAQELIATGNLGEKVGKEKAAVLVGRAKERVIGEQNATKENVTKIIEESAKEQDLRLSKSDKEQLAELMLKIKQLNLNLNAIQKQLRNYSAPPPEPAQPEEPSFFDRLLEFFKAIFSKFFSFVGKIMGR
ncbi:uncharacterized protein YpuA (DUF1002 family) [Hydrogenispora ethanolica]|uniref:Uncharacterized protein YpuA (DUF1002 family) n=1 Tax=Hydrogenispora ethanolica TaxID=1082276 RepID=A0A4V2QF70_HYDET|nr:DUF1002 domain-containing protein [Hydrogenispora ethanolica]TCL70717.1 uncharacterized protein YpuA (DUF1002 family) [Hydrogenispora ethanolica]